MASTMTTEGDHYVANTEYNLLWRNREEKKRSSTDMPFLIIFGLLTVLWIGIGIHGCTTGTPPPEINLQIQNVIQKGMIMEALRYNRDACIGLIWLSVLLIALYFIMVRWLAKLTICITIGVAFVCIMGITYFFLQTSVLVICFIPLLISYAGYGITLYALKKVGMKAVCKVMEDSCKAMTCFPSSLLMLILEAGIQLAALIFTGTAIFYLLFIKKAIVTLEKTPEPYNPYPYADNEYKKLYSIISSNRAVSEAVSPPPRLEVDPPVYVYFLLPIFISCGIWFICFTAAFRRTLLHGIFTHWYRASDKKTISSTISLRYLNTTFRYHMGTIAFQSTIFTFIPVIRALINSSKDLLKQIRKRPVSIYCLWIAVLNAIANASVMCVSYGNSLYQSTKDALQIVMRNPLKYIATRMITQWMIVFGLILIPLLTLCMTGLYIYMQVLSLDVKLPDSYVYVPLIIVGAISSLITGMLLIIFNAAIESVILCFFEESNFAKTSADDEEFLSEDHEV